MRNPFYGITIEISKSELSFETVYSVLIAGRKITTGLSRTEAEYVAKALEKMEESNED